VFLWEAAFTGETPEAPGPYPEDHPNVQNQPFVSSSLAQPQRTEVHPFHSVPKSGCELIETVPTPYRGASEPCLDALRLGGHLKTGHIGTLQNRPTELTQNKSCYTPPTPAPASFFGANGAGRRILAAPGRGIGQRRDATRAPTQGPEWRGGASRPQQTSHSGAKAVNPRGMGTASPSESKPPSF
jgi:hypothetical protein